MRNPKHCCTVDDQEDYLNEWLPKGGLQGDELNDFLYVECLNTLCEDFLIRNDKLGMNFSMEGRFPMLMNHFKNFVMSIPSAYKVNDSFLKGNWSLHNKPLLKEAYKDVLPLSIIMRGKTGWRFPTDETIIGRHRKQAPKNNHLKDYIAEVLSNKDIQEIFEYDDKDIYDKYMNTNDWNIITKTDEQGFGRNVAKPGIGIQSQKQLFTILAFAIWYKVFKMTI